MAHLIYAAICSLDGYVVDADGSFEWAAPSEDVHAFVNDRERDVGTHIYGRRLYEVMRVWQSLPLEGEPDVMRDYAGIWRAADKIVYSSTLDAVDTARTELRPALDLGELARLVEASDRDVSIGGPTLAAPVLRAGLVDEVHLYLNPVVVGGGIRALPDGMRVDLELLEEHRFDGGVVFLRYRAA